MKLRVGILALALLLGACASASPSASPAVQPSGSSTASSAPAGSAPIVTPPAASAPTTPAPSTSAAPAAEADPCVLITRAEAEAQAGGSVTVESGALPGPPGEGAFCRYTSGSGEELTVRTAVGRGDFDNDRRSATVNDQHVSDVPGLGDEAWTDRGQLLSSINVIAYGQWLRISTSSGFGEDAVGALPKLAALAVARLSARTSTASPSTGPSASPVIRAAWDTVLDRMDDGGSVDLETALQAFSLAVAPLPGVRVPEGASGGMFEATLAVDWLVDHLDELTPEQRAAAEPWITPLPLAAGPVIDIRLPCGSTWTTSSRLPNRHASGAATAI